MHVSLGMHSFEWTFDSKWFSRVKEGVYFLQTVKRVEISCLANWYISLFIFLTNEDCKRRIFLQNAYIASHLQTCACKKISACLLQSNSYYGVLVKTLAPLFFWEQLSFSYTPTPSVPFPRVFRNLQLYLSLFRSLYQGLQDLHSFQHYVLKEILDCVTKLSTELFFFFFLISIFKWFLGLPVF